MKVTRELGGDRPANFRPRRLRLACRVIQVPGIEDDGMLENGPVAA